MMGVVWYRLRADVRTRWRALLGLALVAGLALAVVLTSAAGARRTSTAYARFLHEARAGDILAGPFRPDPTLYDRLAEVPGVARVARVQGLGFIVEGTRRGAGSGCLAMGSVDGIAGYDVERPNVLEGRMPDRDVRDEVVANRAFARAFDVRPGDRVRFVLGDENAPVPGVPPLAVTVTGIAAFTDDVIPTTELSAQPQVFAPPPLVSWAMSHQDEGAFEAAFVTLAPGADRRAIDRVRDVVTDEGFVVERRATFSTIAQATRPQGVALWAFTVAAGLAALLVIGQTVARHVALESADSVTLADLGVRRIQLLAGAALRSVVVGIAALALGAVAMVAASSRFPIGPSRLAEPHPGTAVNVAFLVLGGVGLVAVLVTVAAVTALRTGRRDSASVTARPSRAARALAAAGASSRLVIGTRQAFETGRGRSAVPVRSALVGGVVAVAAVVATATFATSLDRLVSDPARYGQRWDAMVDAEFGAAPAGRLVSTLGRSRDVEGIGGVLFGDLRVNGRAMPAVGVDPLSGAFDLTVVAGRGPRNDREIALGSRTLHDLGLKVGDTVEVAGTDGARPHRLTVVGVAVFPQLGQGAFSTLGLGTGVAVRARVLRPFGPDPLDNFAGQLPAGTSVADFRVRGASYNAVALVAAPGRRDALLGVLRRSLHQDELILRTEQRPAAIDNYASVRSTPAYLAVVLGLLGAAMFVHTLVSAVHRRRRDLALCKVVGMCRRDVAAVVAWQATALAAVALVVGLPLGVAGGRLAWRLFADELGVPADATVPFLWLLLVVVGTAVVVNATAAVPAWQAARTAPARLLRSE